MRCARLWDVCQLPDFRKLSTDEHVRLVRTIFLFLMSDDGMSFPTTGWRARSPALDVTEGDVATLSGRLAQIRTWTYAAHRAGWTTRRRALARRHPRGGRPAVGRAA